MKLTKNYFETNCGVIETESGFLRWSNRSKVYIPLRFTINTKKHEYGSDKQYVFCGFYDKIEKKGFSIPYHRFLWIWKHGEIPENYDIDHIDGDSLNNDISNLRAISRSENLKGRKGKSNQHGKDLDPEFKKEIELLRYLKEEYKAQGDKYRWHQFCSLEKNWRLYDSEIRKAIIDNIIKMGL